MCIIKSYKIGPKSCFLLYIVDLKDLSLGQNGIMFLEQLLEYERVFFFREIEIEKYEMKSGQVISIQQSSIGERFEIYDDILLWHYTNIYGPEVF